MKPRLAARFPQHSGASGIDGALGSTKHRTGQEGKEGRGWGGLVEGHRTTYHKRVSHGLREPRLDMDGKQRFGWEVMGHLLLRKKPMLLAAVS